jgi:hypothetical protein
MSSSTGLAVIGGSSIRLWVQWVDWTGAPTVPTTTSLAIINSHGQVLATIPKSGLNHGSTGNYSYDYWTPTLTAPDTLCAQWSATLDNEADVRRYFFTVTP